MDSMSTRVYRDASYGDTFRYEVDDATGHVVERTMTAQEDSALVRERWLAVGALMVAMGREAWGPPEGQEVQLSMEWGD